jgi:hypothetical protein
VELKNVVLLSIVVGALNIINRGIKMEYKSASDCEKYLIEQWLHKNAGRAFSLPNYMSHLSDLYEFITLPTSYQTGKSEKMIYVPGGCVCELTIYFHNKEGKIIYICYTAITWESLTEWKPIQIDTTKIENRATGE